ncbi:hypothetical protein IW261DRAFT_1498447 [Armillaria novae-zelandiae]|uniref:Uncharacterized protein n=1 Tax=Armillaria novae-zelandiae TaxID=153914 RepID=A0AA39U9V9_9AGAR|nr:hypothetical protein IW261DRAFT_1498447 [Armillaria novae-zelandiae]
MPKHLPSNDYPLSSNEYTAYQSCLVLEALGSSWGVVISNLEREACEAVVFKFILGYALHHSPSVEGKAHLVQEILNCNNNGEFLAGLSYLYVMGMIRFCIQKSEGSVPTSLSTMAGNIATALEQPTISSSKAKDLALARDNYCCIVSGIVDLVKVAASTSLGHIFSQSMMDHTAGVMRATSSFNLKFACQLEWAATAAAAAVIEQFAGIPILEEYNLLDQVMLTDADEPQGSFRFINATNKKIPLPDHCYFQLHHACATIAYLSGAGELVLAEDGGSNHLLSLVLSSRLQALSIY